MTAPAQPDSAGWFASLLTPPPPSQHPTLDALGLSDYHPLHALRKMLGGAVQGAAELPGQVAELGRFLSPGELPADLQAVAKPQRAPETGPGIPERLGRLVGGQDTQETDPGLRQAGALAGNLASWELAARSGALGKLGNLGLKTEDVSRPAVGKLVKALQAEGGATLHPNGTPFAGSAYMVADPAFTVTVKTPKEMKAFLARRDVKNAMDAGKLVGKWTDPETHLTEINLSDPVPDMKDAHKLAAQRGEQALGHIHEGAYQGDVRNPHAPVNAVKTMLEGMRTGAQMPRITEIPTTRGQQLAQAYEALPKNDPAAKGAYDALNRDVEKQFKAIQDAGYKVEFTDHDPYKNSAEMIKDVHDNKTLKVFQTPRPPESIQSATVRLADGRVGHGITHSEAYLNAAPEDMNLDHYAGADEGFTTTEGRYLTRKKAYAEGLKYIPPSERAGFHPYMTPEQNDRFRAVHDFLAHAGGGNQFGAVGEENAYRVHASTLSPEALPALAAETRGQNSWVNFGPNAHLPVKERPFAEQKAAAFPQHLLGDYESMGLFGPKAEPAPETIKSAVVKYNGKEYDGTSHLDAMTKIEKQHGTMGGRIWDLVDDNYFRTSTGRVVSRKEGLAIARAAKQTAEKGDRGVSELMRLDGRPAVYPTAEAQIAGAPAIRVNNDWQPTERGVFDRSPEGGVPAGEYREPAPLPFETAPRPRGGIPELAQQIATDPRVEARIQSDAEKGIPLGGRQWYGTLGLRRYLENLKGGVSFADFNQAGAAGSARTPTHNELANASLLLYAKVHGVPYEEARAEFLRRFPGMMKPTFMGMHGDIFDRAQELGFAGPVDPTKGSLKIPNYYHDRMMKATGVPLDTHELRMISQSLGVHESVVKALMGQGGEGYNLMTEPYRRVAAKLGLHPDQVQASRWIGGGPATGLKSQPKGDFLQTLEDGLLYTARRRGMDESPKGLRKLMDAIGRGEDFFLPTSNEGGFPVY